MRWIKEENWFQVKNSALSGQGRSYNNKMVDQNKIYLNIIRLLDDSKAEYKLFEHRAALTYADLEAVQKEAGFFGTEGKCMILRVDEKFIVYVTTFGHKINFDLIKEKLNVGKIRLASPKELKEYFGAEPGCAYPFGFDKVVEIFIDPKIYEEEWFLFSPLYPTKTIQVKGGDLKKVFEICGNKIEETSFNL